ncbi:uncharacterized protein [Malus domestica]|uniref:uncharacterized protein n=1 Tax=Malus domestica TaxID=3750 RepID=UPI003976B68E
MSSSRRVHKQFVEQQKRLLAQQEELINLKEGGGGDEAFAMEEDSDDDHRRQRASHSRRVMEVVGQIAKPRRAANFDGKKGKTRMQRSLFNKIMSAICNHDPYFVKKEDAFRVLGFLPKQKITVALRMLAYRVSADRVDEIARMGKTTVLESLMQFCSAIEALYTNEYLRTPTSRDMRRLLRKVFDDMLQGKSPRYTYWVNGTKYDGPYYLADDIYPRYTTRMFDVEALRSIMMTCIILHNMIVEDEYDYDVIDEYESNPMNNSRTRIYCAHDRTEDPVQHEPLEQDVSYNELIVQRYTDVQEPY